MTNSVRIELANIQRGGALQVAGSLLDESARLVGRDEITSRWPWFKNATFNVNSAVLAATTEDLGPLKISQRDLRGRPGLRGARNAPSVSFVLFGPLYGLHPAAATIAGFADGTSLYPEFVRPHDPKYLIRRQMSKQFFRRSHMLIVEAPHVAADLNERWGIPRGSIATVPNTLNTAAQRYGNSVGRSTSRLTTSPRPPEQTIVLGYPTRPYPHKNLDFLGQALAAWERVRPETPVRLLLTLDESELGAQTGDVRRFAETTGPLRPDELPDFYASVDAVVFPSLIECFSATPLEAMHHRKPILASDRDFVRNVANDVPWYFEPTRPTTLLQALDKMLNASPGEMNQRIDKGMDVVDSWPSAFDRAVSYFSLIDSVLEEQGVGSQ